jgi:hypothetical protein
MLGEVDKNNDGKISYEEFKKILLSKVWNYETISICLDFNIATHKTVISKNKK